MGKAKRGKVVSYNKWGYIFLIPFVTVYLVFQLIPLVSTVYNSFFENYRAGLTQVGPNFIGLKNYATLFTNGDLLIYTKNTVIMWIMGFVPQILMSLLLGAWFSDPSMRLKFQRFFKTVIYLPNLIMASAFAMLFFALFADSGPINSILIGAGILSAPFRFMSNIWSVRGLVAFMNFIMWFGNTTILLMAGMMGIDPNLYEAAQVDGANWWQTFTRITLPLLMPVTFYLIVTGVIGGAQMYVEPRLMFTGNGPSNSTFTTVIHLYDRTFVNSKAGYGSAVAVFLAIIVFILTLIQFRLNGRGENK